MIHPAWKQNRCLRCRCCVCGPIQITNNSEPRFIFYDSHSIDAEIWSVHSTSSGCDGDGTLHYRPISIGRSGEEQVWEEESSKWGLDGRNKAWREAERDYWSGGNDTWGDKILSLYMHIIIIVIINVNQPHSSLPSRSARYSLLPWIRRRNLRRQRPVWRRRR